MTDQQVYRLPLPWMRPPLTLNQRLHWAKKAQLTKGVRGNAYWRAAHHQLPKGVGYARVQLHYRPRDRRRRDTDNLVPTLKALADGLVDYGLVADDTPEFMDKPQPIIEPPAPKQPGCMWLVVTTWPEKPA
ncbi:hypothetical protein C1Y63_10480 [Corynebacterium sp. 13CS0277]|uniref:hypothetical protein n=1 Tax=Corynebacterium sp. 13CS0277 TaxID=2071994 RepID=UPI000D03702B|nr:hypothetical protein [Corynebacterium sp. 13CS0277]PRQ10612.1 hypothetical protein C1Y63_10480 [Corynebacterium sp. 13CS0277]